MQRKMSDIKRIETTKFQQAQGVISFLEEFTQFIIQKIKNDKHTTKG